MVQTPVVSVSPYDVTTELSPSTSNISRTRVGGMTAAPVTPTRKDANAGVPPHARSINAWKRVGGPWMTVTPWSAASASKRSGLNLETGRAAGAEISQASKPVLWPLMCENGLITGYPKVPSPRVTPRWIPR